MVIEKSPKLNKNLTTLAIHNQFSSKVIALSTLSEAQSRALSVKTAVSRKIADSAATIRNVMVVTIIKVPSKLIYLDVKKSFFFITVIFNPPEKVSNCSTPHVKDFSSKRKFRFCFLC